MNAIAVTLMCVIVASTTSLKERDKDMRSDCAANIDPCDHLAWDKGTLTGDDCFTLVNALTCLREIPECYLLAQDVVSPWNASSPYPQRLENIFCNETLGQCQMTYHKCLLHFADMLVTLPTVLDVNVMCQDLTNYTQCLQYMSSGCPKKQRVSEANTSFLVDQETAEDGQVPGLESADCEPSVQNCLRFALKKSKRVLGSLTEEPMKHLVCLTCHSPVKRSMSELSLRDGRPSGCITAPELTPQDCASPMSACLRQYHDNLVVEASMKDKVSWLLTAFNDAAVREAMPLLVHATEREKLCRGLKAYSVCLRGITTCEVDEDQVESMVLGERRRLMSYSSSRSNVHTQVCTRDTAQETSMPWWLTIGLSVARFIEIVILPIFHLVHIE